jgi:hypothetical protein
MDVERQRVSTAAGGATEAMSFRVGVSGIQEAQNANAKAIAAIRPSGALGRAIRNATAEAHRYVVAITHVWHYKGGALRAAHRMKVTDVRGEIFLDPKARSPRTGQLVTEYGPEEHRRGGSHAFYERTEKERGPRIAARAMQTIKRGMP